MQLGQGLLRHVEPTRGVPWSYASIMHDNMAGLRDSQPSHCGMFRFGQACHITPLLPLCGHSWQCGSHH